MPWREFIRAAAPWTGIWVVFWRRWMPPIAPEAEGDRTPGRGESHRIRQQMRRFLLLSATRRRVNLLSRGASRARMSSDDLRPSVGQAASRVKPTRRSAYRDGSLEWKEIVDGGTTCPAVSASAAQPCHCRSTRRATESVPNPRSGRHARDSRAVDPNHGCRLRRHRDRFATANSGSILRDPLVVLR